ncbi:MAG: DUF4157 domain-containing protein, partial [Pseudomonadota bacterium]
MFKRARTADAGITAARPFFSNFANPAPFFNAPPAVQTKTDDDELVNAEDLTPAPEPARSGVADTPVPPPDDTPTEPPASGSTPLVQAKLKVGAADDPFEREADAIADHVVHGDNAPDATPLPHSTPTPRRQREDDEESAGKPLQTKGGVAGEAPSTVHNGIEQTRGAGSALSASTQHAMEEAIGADFSEVRVHTDNQAQAMNRQLQARAFTTGNDIYFNAGEYQPDAHEGRHLLAHELAHVVQQTGAQSAHDGGGASPPLSRAPLDEETAMAGDADAGA